jgi:hypothetical protein
VISENGAIVPWTEDELHLVREVLDDKAMKEKLYQAILTGFRQTNKVDFMRRQHHYKRVVLDILKHPEMSMELVEMCKALIVFKPREGEDHG